MRRAVLAPHGRTCTLGFPGCELTGAHVSEEADSRGGDVRSETRIQQSGSSLVKIDTEKYPNIASKFKVEALPTIILFKNGQVADRIEGLPDAAQLTERLKYMLGAS